MIEHQPGKVIQGSLEGAGRNFPREVFKRFSKGKRKKPTEIDYGLIVGEILQLLDSWGLVRDVFKGFFCLSRIIFGLCPQLVYRQNHHRPPRPKSYDFQFARLNDHVLDLCCAPGLTLSAGWTSYTPLKSERSLYTLEDLRLEPTNHPFRKENDLNQTSMIMFPVNLQGCISTVFVSGFRTQPTNCFKTGRLA